MTVDEANRLIRQRNAQKGQSNRRSGELFEFDVLNIMKQRAVLAVRSAGSHSEADVIAVFKNKTWLITCKINGYLTNSEKEVLYSIKKKLGENYEIKLAWRDNNRKIRFETI